MMYGAVNALIRQMNGELNNVQSLLWVSILPCRCVLDQRTIVTNSLSRPSPSISDINISQSETKVAVNLHIVLIKQYKFMSCYEHICKVFSFLSDHTNFTWRTTKTGEKKKKSHRLTLMEAPKPYQENLSWALFTLGQ